MTVWSHTDRKLHLLSADADTLDAWIENIRGVPRGDIGGVHLAYDRRVFGCLLLRQNERDAARTLYILGEDRTLPGGARTILSPATRFHPNVMLFLDWLLEMETFDGMFFAVCMRQKNCSLRRKTLRRDATIDL